MLATGLAGAALAAPLLGGTVRRTLFLACAAGGAPVATAAFAIARAPTQLDGTSAAAADVGVLIAKVCRTVPKAMKVFIPSTGVLQGAQCCRGFAQPQGRDSAWLVRQLEQGQPQRLTMVHKHLIRVPSTLLKQSCTFMQVQAATAGAMLVAALWLLMPAARAARGISANKGFVLGCVVAAFVHGLSSLLCLATPYCLRASGAE